MSQNIPQAPSHGRRWGWIGLIAVVGGVAIAAAVALYFRTQPSPQPQPQPGNGSADPLALGKQVYENHCAQCHGTNGDGDGPAARFLYPKPRNFQLGVFRIVSATGNIPTDADLMRVINRGMPGSAMVPFGHLPEQERQALVTYVRHLTTSGIEGRLRAALEQAGESIVPEELAADVERLTETGPLVEVPAHFPPGDADSIARGKQSYMQLCAPCHGATGKGEGQEDQRNSDGTPNRPRDFTLGIFKGGRDPQQMYLRIRRGMPGSPMPGNNALEPEAITDMINFVLSLSDPGVAEKVEHQRRTVKVTRSASALNETIPDDAWEQSQGAGIVVSPLWWRNHIPPELEVRALHDGKTLAVRLTWLDETQNDSAVSTEQFVDMASVALFRGSPEPFLGMGNRNQPVDVWLWNALAGEKADVDSAYPNMIVDTYPFEKPGDQPGKHTLAQQPVDFLTARAAGNRHADVSRPGGDHLSAEGFGSLTLRPTISQVVKTNGTWKAGRWSVVLRRPLTVEAGAGLTLASGDKLSISFAIWDGAHRDRNGQKMVSIWHDLVLD